jgi:tRNA (guanine37-N1)-methyltransferase
VDHAAERMQVDEVSIGDYVLNGGEVAVLVMVEAIARLLPGVIGNPESLAEESHSGTGLLEYPVYTKPPSWRGYDVPDVLLSGNHALVAKWRHEESVRRTAQRRPDLLAAWGGAAVRQPETSAPDLIKVLPATEADAGEIYTLQCAAAGAAALASGGVVSPSVEEPLDSVVERTREGALWKAVVGTRIVGAIHVAVEGELARLIRLVVAPDWQGHRVGPWLLSVAEQTAPPEVTTYELVTRGAYDEDLRSYQRAGYREQWREQDDTGVESVRLVKRRRR